MSLAIDYDGTFDTVTPFWREVIKLAAAFDIQCWFVTCRSRDDFDDDEFDALVEMTGLPRHRHLFTAGVAKQWYCEQRGIYINWWIDDDPACVGSGK